MATRTFPFTPKSATRLEVGDLISIACEDGTWAVLQVSALHHCGKARSSFGVGTLPWRGNEPPTAATVAGLDFLEHAMTRIEIFSEGGAEVVACAPLAGGVQSNLNEQGVGTRHLVWGWNTAINRAKEAR